MQQLVTTFPERSADELALALRAARGSAEAAANALLDADARDSAVASTSASPRPSLPALVSRVFQRPPSSHIVQPIRAIKLPADC